MTGARRRALFLLAVALLLAGSLALARYWRNPAQLPPRPASARPKLLLLTSLPLIFAEDFSLKNNRSGAFKRLQVRYRVVPISVTNHADLARGRLLLMAQPQAQTAENLVTLDDWVRGGGRVLLLADPMLEWPSERPLGDPLRPPPMFTDTGLLGHWGLRLDAPEARRPEKRKLAGFDVMAVSPGQLFGNCQVSPDRFVADCRIGKGAAIVVADADFIGMDGRGDAKFNLDGLLGALAKVESK